ncbi:ankyrin repeat domain-containing protein 54 [Culicoides brevitarsis]|uniref:ankyrin repeat domain-containing protein 54 n=1 Tax=Culicoides brevitarsis TaxID=469753 RepID=UPI00307BAB45
MDTNPLGITLPSDTITQEFFQNYKLPEIEDCPGKIRKNMTNNNIRKRYRFTSSYVQIYNKRLLEAVSTNNTEKVLNLLENCNVSPNAADEQKRSALHIATTRNYVDMVRILLEHGANPNQVDSIGNTPLHLASCTRHLETVTLLIKYGASTLVTDRNGFHPLALAYSKLKHCEKFKPKCMTQQELAAYYDTIVNIYNLILHHFDIQKSEAEYMDFKNMEEKFREMNTKEDIDKEVMSLLESLEKFTVTTKPATTTTTKKF